MFCSEKHTMGGSKCPAFKSAITVRMIQLNLNYYEASLQLLHQAVTESVGFVESHLKHLKTSEPLGFRRKPV